MIPQDGADIAQGVLSGFALACVICLGFYALVALVLEFVPDPSCGCLTGCGPCAAGRARVIRNRVFLRRLLAGVLVLAAWALLASALAGCQSCRDSLTGCPRGMHAIDIHVPKYDCSIWSDPPVIMTCDTQAVCVTSDGYRVQP